MFIIYFFHTVVIHENIQLPLYFRKAVNPLKAYLNICGSLPSNCFIKTVLVYRRQS